MIPSDLTDCEATLRRAVVEQRFSAMEAAIESYCELANAHLSTLTADPAMRSAFLKHLVGVLEWAHLMLRVARMGYADQLNSLRLTRRYLTPGAAQQQAVRMDG